MHKLILAATLTTLAGCTTQDAINAGLRPALYGINVLVVDTDNPPPRYTERVRRIKWGNPAYHSVDQSKWDCQFDDPQHIGNVDLICRPKKKRQLFGLEDRVFDAGLCAKQYTDTLYTARALCGVSPTRK